MSEPIQGEAPPPSVSRSRGKLIAIVVAVILVLVAVSAVAVYYLIPAGFSGTIKVGFTISLTGTFNVEGTNSLNGIKTAANWINTADGSTDERQHASTCRSGTRSTRLCDN